MFQLHSVHGLSLGVPSPSRLLRLGVLDGSSPAFGDPCRSLGPDGCHRPVSPVGWRRGGVFQLHSVYGLSLSVPSPSRLLRLGVLDGNSPAFGDPCRSLGPVGCHRPVSPVGWRRGGVFQLHSVYGLSLGVPSPSRLLRLGVLDGSSPAFGDPCRSLGPVGCHRPVSPVGWILTPIIC